MPMMTLRHYACPLCSYQGQVVNAADVKGVGMLIACPNCGVILARVYAKEVKPGSKPQDPKPPKQDPPQELKKSLDLASEKPHEAYKHSKSDATTTVPPLGVPK